MRRIELVIVIFLSVKFFDCSKDTINCTSAELPDDNNSPRAYTNWDDENKTKLLKIYYNTDTGKKGRQMRIKDKWDQLNGRRMPQSAHNLYMRAWSWIKEGEAERLLTEQERRGENSKLLRAKTTWTPKMKEDILKFYEETDPKKWNQSKRIKKIWDRKYPDYSDIKAHNLMVQVGNLLKRQGKEYNTKIVTLTWEQKMDLLRSYYMASKCGGEHSILMREFFIKRHPQFANTSHSVLRCQVSSFRKQHPEIDEEISRELSLSRDIYHSWTSGGRSGSKQQESPRIPTFQGYDLHEGSDQNPGSKHIGPWDHHITEGASSSGYQIFSDVGTSHKNVHSSHIGEDRLRESEQNNVDERQRKSSKGKEPVLDLDLHLR